MPVMVVEQPTHQLLLYSRKLYYCSVWHYFNGDFILYITFNREVLLIVTPKLLTAAAAAREKLIFEATLI